MRLRLETNDAVITPQVTMAIMIVESALISGETPRRTAEKILIGSVVAEGPVAAEIPFLPRLARETDAGRPPTLDGGDDDLAPLVALADRVAAARRGQDSTPTAESP